MCISKVSKELLLEPSTRIFQSLSGLKFSETIVKLVIEEKNKALKMNLESESMLDNNEGISKKRVCNVLGKLDTGKEFHVSL